MKTPIGATINFYWNDENVHPEAEREYHTSYISFDVDYNEEESEFDKFGVSDDEVFMYLANEQELRDLQESNCAEFVINWYELEYEKEPFNTEYMFHSDSGHGWLQVLKNELVALKIEDRITPFSYMNDDYAYLEEDYDMAIFIRNHPMPDKIKLIENNVNGESMIRRFKSYYHEK